MHLFRRRTTRRGTVILRCGTGLLAVLGLVAACGDRNGSGQPATGPSHSKASQALPDSSRTSVDWAGSYHGVLPCADCEGIDTTITLSRDLTFVLRSRYLGKSDRVFERRGSFTWDVPSDDPANACTKLTLFFKHPAQAGTAYDYRTFLVVGTAAQGDDLRDGEAEAGGRALRNPGNAPGEFQRRQRAHARDDNSPLAIHAIASVMLEPWI